MQHDVFFVQKPENVSKIHLFVEQYILQLTSFSATQNGNLIYCTNTLILTHCRFNHSLPECMQQVNPMLGHAEFHNH